MEGPAPTLLRIGDWCVNSALGQISRNGETTRVDARTMRLLVCLAERAGQVVSIDDLLDQVWPGVAVTPDSVYQAVTSLRRLLGDDAKRPTYVATVPRQGYRMVASVGAWQDSPTDAHTVVPADEGTAAPRRRAGFQLAVAALLCLALALAFLLYRKAAGNQPPAAIAATGTPQPIAVLPFLDLTEGMNEETFADGMTEELIDKLSKVPGLQVPPPTSSFYFKERKTSLADIARTLRVKFVLDGSVRKSGGRVRVAARLVRADDGFVIWTETYDRPFDDIIMVQDDIAGEVTKALKSSIGSKSGNHP